MLMDKWQTENYMDYIGKQMADEYRKSLTETYRTYELDFDKINSIEDCKKILNFLCKHTLKPHPITWEYVGFKDVEEYFIGSK